MARHIKDRPRQRPRRGDSGSHAAAASQPAISSGFFRGMKLKAPAGASTRPTLAKTRAAVINAVQGVLEGARFCDLFAGSGAIGIEALSRGAASCVFVEKDAAAIAALVNNLSECQRRCAAQGLEVPPMPVVRGDVMDYLQTCRTELSGDSNARKYGVFDLIWVDPPYALVTAILPDLLRFAEDALAPDGLVMVESGASQAGAAIERQDIAGQGSLILKAEKKYGGTFVTTWQKK